MKKILVVANNDVGLYKFRKELITELLKDNEVYISLPYGELVENLVQMGCHFIDTPLDRRGINPLKDLKLILNYYKLIKKSDCDMVITYTIKPNIYGGMICRLLHKKYSCNITGLGTAFQSDNLLKKLIVKLYKFALKKVHVVFFENKENQNIFIDNGIVQKNKTVLLNGAGVNLEEYKFTEYPKDNENIRFLFIARVMKEKGIDEFLYAAKKVKEQYSYVDFDIVGPYEDNYSEIINSYVDEGIVNYYGFQSDVRPFVKNCHCFVLPSYHEGMANTNLECASMGRPLITSNIHGCKESVVENVSGFLCEKENGDSLLKCMQKFIEFSYNDKKNMGIESRKHMENVFDKRKVVEKTVKILFK